MINALQAKAVGNNLQTQPDPTELASELNGLINKIATSGSVGNATKAACAAVLGSAAVTVQ